RSSAAISLYMLIYSAAVPAIKPLRPAALSRPHTAAAARQCDSDPSPLGIIKPCFQLLTVDGKSAPSAGILPHIEPGGTPPHSSPFRGVIVKPRTAESV